MSDDANTGSDDTARYAENMVSAPAEIAAELSSEERSAIAALPVSSALLVVLNGPNQGSRFLLDEDTTQVGRHPDADIFLDDVTVSRRHAEFLRTKNQFEVHDLGSMNGTYVGGKSVERCTLKDGDEIQIGKFRLTFFAGSTGNGGR